MYQIGDCVRITRRKSVKHFTVADMPIVGVIEQVDHEHRHGPHLRPYQIRFTDGRLTWWGGWEFKGIKCP